MALDLLRDTVTQEEKRLIALKRAEELRDRIKDYLEQKDKIPSGLALKDEIAAARERIMKVLGATESEWNDWRWQMRNRITDARTLASITGLSAEDAAEIDEVGRRYRWAISPYYAALVAVDKRGGPIWRQAVPSKEELNDDIGVEDPMAEEFTSPAPAVTRRYPDRLIINVTNQCAMYCRHCQRRRNIGEVDIHRPVEMLEQALAYIRKNTEIRDVLITGGDALLLSDNKLEWLLAELDRIDHVEIKRIGTRTIVTMPQRITAELCAVLEKYPPIYINTQFNHPLEVTEEASEACNRLVKAGVVLGNQAVLLRGVNNSPHVMKKLNHELLKIRVRPYYIFHAKQVRGTSHFITSVDEGLEIIENLRGFTSGLAVPTYIINAPHGYGKIPVSPQYLLTKDENQVVLRTWERRIIHYSNGHR